MGPGKHFIVYYKNTNKMISNALRYQNKLESRGRKQVLTIQRKKTPDIY